LTKGYVQVKVEFAVIVAVRQVQQIRFKSPGIQGKDIRFSFSMGIPTFSNASDYFPRCERGDPAWPVALLFPLQGDWTEADYLALQNRTKRLVELSDGQIEVLSVPSPYHQRIVRFLFRLLEACVASLGAGEVLFAPLPIRLWQGKYRDPDVAFLKPGRIADPRHQPHGADLVIEVVSDDEEDRQRDFETKRQEYAQAGVAEYWIVDPKTETILVLTLDGTTYRTHGEFTANTMACSLLLPAFTVAVSDVFAAGRGETA
jgi:Uma2 family endonuclease